MWPSTSWPDGTTRWCLRARPSTTSCRPSSKTGHDHTRVADRRGPGGPAPGGAGQRPGPLAPTRVAPAHPDVDRGRRRRPSPRCSAGLDLVVDRRRPSPGALHLLGPSDRHARILEVSEGPTDGSDADRDEGDEADIRGGRAAGPTAGRGDSRWWCGPTTAGRRSSPTPRSCSTGRRCPPATGWSTHAAGGGEPAGVDRRSPAGRGRGAHGQDRRRPMPATPGAGRPDRPRPPGPEPVGRRRRDPSGGQVPPRPSGLVADGGRRSGGGLDGPADRTASDLSPRAGRGPGPGVRLRGPSVWAAGARWTGLRPGSGVAPEPGDDDAGDKQDRA